MPLSLLDRQKLTGEILGAIAAELKTPSRGVPVRLTEVSWTSGIMALVVEQGTGLYVRPAAGFHAEVTRRRFSPTATSLNPKSLADGRSFLSQSRVALSGMYPVFG